MKLKKKNSPTKCKCGSQVFEILPTIRHSNGRKEFALNCRQCGEVLSVSKDTYALYSYLNSGKKVSQFFLKLFDLA